MKLPLLACLLFPVLALAQTATLPREFVPPPYDAYFKARVAELSGTDWQNGITAENWPARQAAMRRQLQGMLGLDPWPERGDLKPTITGTLEGDGFRVEKLHFQASPGLYVTANLYLPREVTQPLPAILYLCGHSHMSERGISFGNKTGYAHHGAWYARHGYVCLVIDTIDLGEIPGEHHGTYAHDRWWWPARGYTPAGVEAWRGIRALDYLLTRPEVDPKRIGVTGRSGGGAYSWWVAALDERVAVAAPTAGITTLKDYVVDGCIEGHCDCMFMVNGERWDFDRVAALVAPRPLCIVNTDKDPIFPLDGVMQIYNRTRALYKTLGAEANIGLQIAEGPHADTQPLNTGEFHWMDRFLQGAAPLALTDEPMRKYPVLAPAALRVFTTLPPDETVTTVDNFFGPSFVPGPIEPWAPQRNAWMAALKDDCFRAWPAAGRTEARVVREATQQGVHFAQYELQSDGAFKEPLWVLQREGLKPEELDLVVLNVLDDRGFAEFSAMAASGFPAAFPGVTAHAADWDEAKRMFTRSKWAMAYTTPRGAGATSLAALPINKRRQILRRFQLLGETLESGQVWDIAQAGDALRRLPGFGKVPLWLQAERVMAANAVYASLFLDGVARLDLHAMPASHWQGPPYLNVLRHLDLPQAVAMAAEHSTVAIYSDDPQAWAYPAAVAKTLGWGEKRVQIRQPLEGAK